MTKNKTPLALTSAEAEVEAASYYLKQPYVRLVVPEADGTYRAEMLEFQGCIATGLTAADALGNLEDAAESWLLATMAQKQNIPSPVQTSGFSGKLVLRLPKGLHKKASLAAEHEGVSLNHFITCALAECVGERARPHAVSPSYTFIKLASPDDLAVARSGWASWGPRNRITEKMIEA